MAKLVLIQGESIDWDFTYADTEGTPIDVTGYTLIAAAKRIKYDKAMLFKYEHGIDEELTVVNAQLGQINLKVIDTTTYPVGMYVLEIAYKRPDGMTSKPEQIILEVKEGIIL